MRAFGACFAMACLAFAGCGDDPSRTRERRSGTAARSYEQRVRAVFDRYSAEYAPLKAKRMGALGREVRRVTATLERAHARLAAITPPARFAPLHTAALQAFERQADAYGRFLYDVEARHQAPEPALRRFARRLGRTGPRDQRAIEALRAAVGGG